MACSASNHGQKYVMPSARRLALQLAQACTSGVPSEPLKLVLLLVVCHQARLAQSVRSDRGFVFSKW